MKPHLHLLAKLGACSEAQAFAHTVPDLETAWNTCDRSDWMIWLLRRLKYDDAKVYRLYACWCVRNTPLADGRKVWDLLTDPRSRNAVEVAERFANGEATAEDLSEARGAADTTYAYVAADTTYAYVAADTTYAVAADANATYAAAADVAATYAAVVYANAAYAAYIAAAATYAAVAYANAAYAADVYANVAAAYAYAAAYADAAKIAARKAQTQQLREMVPFAVVAGLVK